MSVRGSVQVLLSDPSFAGAIASMQQSSAQAAAILRRFGATACTDVTGFGLLGHLQEVALASQVSLSFSKASQAL